MSTLTGDYTLHNSSAVTENTAADGTQDGTDATGFGLKPMPRSGSGEGYSADMVESGPRINIKTVFPRYGDSHVKDKMVGETVLSLTWESLYW